MKNLFLSILLFSGSIIVNAQTEITSADVANIFAPGKGWISVSNDDPQITMDDGSASGSSQSWVITNIVWKIQIHL